VPLPLRLIIYCRSRLILLFSAESAHVEIVLTIRRVGRSPGFGAPGKRFPNVMDLRKVGYIIAVAITAIGMFGADNSLGTWKRNFDKTNGSKPRTVKSLTTVREASDGGVRVTSTGENVDGTPINSTRQIRRAKNIPSPEHLGTPSPSNK